MVRKKNSRLTHKERVQIETLLNKRNTDKISTHKQLQFYVFKGLLSRWTPEQISGRLEDKYPNNPIMSISHESIYRYIYLMTQARLNKKLIKLLVHHKSRYQTPKKDVRQVVKN